VKPRRSAPLVTFWLGAQEFAFDVFDVVEMKPVAHLTRLPGAPARVAGVTAWRGKTIPVIALGALLKLAGGAPDVKKRLLVLARPGAFAVLVDRPGRILAPERLVPVEVSPADREAKEIMALARTDRGLLRLLDPSLVIGGGPPLAPAPSRESA
jgi:purine-binding chemotaxis protein CheW